MTKGAPTAYLPIPTALKAISSRRSGGGLDQVENIHSCLQPGFFPQTTPLNQGGDQFPVLNFLLYPDFVIAMYFEYL